MKGAKSQRDKQQAKIMYSRVHHLYAAAVDDTYKLAVWLPPDYEAWDERLPVVYVLDEPEFFGFASGIALNYFLHDDNPTRMMIVAIGKELDSLDDWWSIRWRDFSPVAIPPELMSGHADKFLEFLSRDIIPFIDTHYRTDTGNRTLWGHSLAGMFTIYTLREKPDLFQQYIATSPAFVAHDTDLLPYKEELQKNTLQREKKLYVSVGALEANFKPYIDVFAQTIQSSDYPNLDFTYELLEGLAHMPAALTGFIRGMRSTLDNFDGLITAERPQIDV